MVKFWARFLVEHRLGLALASLVFTALAAIGAKNLFFETDYRIFFGKDFVPMLEHDALQEAYTKSDSVLIAIAPPAGDIFNRQYLDMLRNITQDAWQMPYSIRVDSISNFQHTTVVEDELTVGDLIPQNATLDAATIAKIKQITLNHPQLANKIVGKNGAASLIVVSLELPPMVDRSQDLTTQAQQRNKRDQSFVELLAASKAIKQQIIEQNPGYLVHLIGDPIVNEAFNESSKRDMSTLIPLMYLIIVVLLFAFFRSYSAVFAICIIVALGSAATMGISGWLYIPLNQVNIASPVIILTIAVCDGVHLLVIYLRSLAAGNSKTAAMIHSFEVNIQPIFLTTLTTVVGFLSLQFSKSPPFRELGIICACGVTLAMVFTFTLLPYIVMLFGKHKKIATKENSLASFQWLANFIIKRPLLIFCGSILVAAIIIPQGMRNKLNDDSLTYFKPGTEVRDAADFIEDKITAVQHIAYDLRCASSNCINNPQFLQQVASFVAYMESFAEVRHVESYIDVIKILNKNMNAGDSAYQKIPASQDLAAQYQLLYEMSLPYGLDLHNQVNFDKSGLRVTVSLASRESSRFIAIDQQAKAWLAKNYPHINVKGSSNTLMFAHMGIDNIKSMIRGSIFALIGVTLTLIIALRSWRYGFISLLPNAFPAAATLGIWGLLISQVNLAVAVVFSVTLGIVVDDTVHFLSKYLRALRHEGKSSAASLRYAFSTVGNALLITTVVLATGFGLLYFSDFSVNAYLGSMTAMTIVVALLFDFLFLPALLLLLDRKLAPLRQA